MQVLCYNAVCHESVKSLWSRRDTGSCCYYGGYVLRHVLSVEGVQTHGEGKRTGGDCTPTEICPLREHPTGTAMSAGQLEQFKVEMSVFHSWVNFCSWLTHDVSAEGQRGESKRQMKHFNSGEEIFFFLYYAIILDWYSLRMAIVLS